MQTGFLNGTKNRTSGHAQFEMCEVYHGVLGFFSVEYLYLIATLDTARSHICPSQATEKVCQPWKVRDSVTSRMSVSSSLLFSI